MVLTALGHDPKVPTEKDPVKDRVTIFYASVWSKRYDIVFILTVLVKERIILLKSYTVHDQWHSCMHILNTESLKF